MKKRQLDQELVYALCENPPDYLRAKQLLDVYRKDCEEDAFDLLLLKLVRDYPLNSRECEACNRDVECVKACPKYTLKHLPEIIRFFLNEGWNHRKHGIGLHPVKISMACGVYFRIACRMHGTNFWLIAC